MPRNTLGAERCRDGAVRQKFMKNTLSWKLQDLKRHLDKPIGLKEVKQRYEVIIAEEVELKPCALRCKGCSKLISITQPHVSAKQHSISCTKPPAVDEEMEVLDEGDGEEHSGKRKRLHSLAPPLHAHFPSAGRCAAGPAACAHHWGRCHKVRQQLLPEAGLWPCGNGPEDESKPVVLICRSVHSSSVV